MAPHHRRLFASTSSAPRQKLLLRLLKWFWWKMKKSRQKIWIYVLGVSFDIFAFNDDSLIPREMKKGKKNWDIFSPWFKSAPGSFGNFSVCSALIKKFLAGKLAPCDGERGREMIKKHWHLLASWLQKDSAVANFQLIDRKFLRCEPSEAGMLDKRVNLLRVLPISSCTL